MFTVKQSSAPSIAPYIALSYRTFAVKVFQTGPAEIYPMWSGEGNLSYLVVNTANRETLLIDPDVEILGSYLLTLDKENLTLAALIDTHNHAEHATAAPVLKQLFTIPYLMHSRAPSSLVSDRVTDGETRQLIGLDMQFFHTPGHTTELMSVRLGSHLFTGDSLFNRGCGRADLPGGDAHQQYDSIHRIARFPDSYIIHPGHDYDNQLSSTIAEVKRQNPRLQMATKDEFVQFMQAHYANVEQPDDLMYYVAFNAR